jgi:peroxiredoxin
VAGVMIAISHSLFLLVASAAFEQPPSSGAKGSQSAFASIPTNSEDTLRFQSRIPAFEVKDVTGQTWHTEDLLGKFTLIYFWRTGWAREADAHPGANPGFIDLPDLQRFYDKVKNAKNIQVLAFCLDYDYTHAPDYMNEKKYTFPVVADWALAKKLFPGTENGRLYWLVNREGQLSYPFHSWSLGRLIFEIEKAAAQE